MTAYSFVEFVVGSTLFTSGSLLVLIVKDNLRLDWGRRAASETSAEADPARRACLIKA
jgi:hypothetical protein